MISRAAIAIAVLLCTARARAEDPRTDDIAALRAELASQRRAIERLETAEAERKIFRLSGFIQADAVVHSQASENEIDTSTGQPLNQDRFLIRRARLHGDLDWRYVAGALELDGNTINGPIARIVDAEATVRWPVPERAEPPLVALTIGLFRTPFGYELRELDWQRHFLERSNVMNALFPGVFDLGAKLWGGYGFVRYSLAVMNGAPLGDKQLAARDPNKSKDLVARLGVDTKISDSVRFEAGISGLSGTGFHEGTPSTKDVLVWRDANEDGVVQLTEIQAIAGQPATPSENFDRFAFGSDMRITARLPAVGTFAIYGEVLWSENLDRGLFYADPVATGRDLREFGFYAGITQDITQYGAIGVRYDRYDPDADARVQLPTKLVPNETAVSTVAIAAALRLPPHFRVIGEYDINRNAQGRSDAGLPANLASNALSFRGEVVF